MVHYMVSLQTVCSLLHRRPIILKLCTIINIHANNSYVVTRVVAYRFSWFRFSWVCKLLLQLALVMSTAVAVECSGKCTQQQ